MTEAECPACGDLIKVGSVPKMGQRVVCRNCRTALKVTWLSPLDLDWYEGGYDEEDDIRVYRRPGKKFKRRDQTRFEF